MRSWTKVEANFSVVPVKDEKKIRGCVLCILCTAALVTTLVLLAALAGFCPATTRGPEKWLRPTLGLGCPCARPCRCSCVESGFCSCLLSGCSSQDAFSSVSGDSFETLVGSFGALTLKTSKTTTTTIVADIPTLYVCHKEMSRSIRSATITGQLGPSPRSIVSPEVVVDQIYTSGS